MQLAAELVHARLVERELELVADPVIRLAGARVGVQREVVGRVAGDRVHRVGADPVPGDVLAEIDVDNGSDHL